MNATVTVHFKDRSRNDLIITGVEKVAPSDFGFTKFSQGPDWTEVWAEDISYYKVRITKDTP